MLLLRLPSDASTTFRLLAESHSFALKPRFAEESVPFRGELPLAMGGP